jgi:hypothetical protein
MMIAGSNFLSKPYQGPYSYYYSIWSHIWGWASWRRAWQYHDMTMALWPIVRAKGWLEDMLRNSRTVQYFRKIFDETANGKIDTWDYQWLFACWMHGLTIHPNVNLVSNIGCRDDATNTKSPTDFRASLPCSPMLFPLRHPPHVQHDHQTDQFFIDHCLVPNLPKPPSLLRLLYRQCVSVLPGPLQKGLSFLKKHLISMLLSLDAIAFDEFALELICSG